MKKKTAIIVTLLAFSSVFLAPIASVQAWSWNWWRAPEPEIEVEKNPIVFVHGFMGGDYNWFIMKDRFIDDGWSEDLLYVIDFEHGIVGSNVDNAHQLDVFIDDVLQETGAEKVDIVCHSMGAMSTRYYIKYLGGVDKVEDYVSISGIHFGTIYGKLPLVDKLMDSVKEMEPGSDFLEDLNSGDLTPGDIDYTSIALVMDIIAVPYTTSILPGADLIINWWGEHNTQLYSKDVYGWTKKAIA